MSKVQIGRQLFSEDTDIRMYHVSTKLVDTVSVSIAGIPQEGSSPMGDAMLTIDGVEQVMVHPYCIVIKKAKMWEWSQIEPKLKALVTSFVLPVANVLADRPDEN